METIRTPEKALAFLSVLAETANVSKACDGAGVGRSAMYAWRREDQEFAAKWDEAMDVGVGALEDEAHRRAFEGCDEPVYYLGQKVDTVKKYSDTLAIFLLKAHRPNRYRERYEGILSGNIAITKRAAELSDDQLASIAAASDAASCDQS